MSNRAVKKLRGGKDDLSVLASNLKIEDEIEDGENMGRSQKKKVVNMFDLVRKLVN